MFELTWKFDDKVLAAYRDLATTAKAKVDTFVNGTFRQHIEQQVQNRLVFTPGAAESPLHWTPAKVQDKPPNTRWGYYSKQKAAYFATNGFGRGIPSVRSGALNRSYRVITTTQGIAIFNVAPYAKFVVGEYQQPFHRNTGWQLADPIAADILLQSVSFLADAWFDIMRLKPLT